MAISKLNPVSGGKTQYRLTLLSGTSWTVPAGVTYVNVTLIGGGGGGTGSPYGDNGKGIDGRGGQIVNSTLTTTPGASITYAIGAGGSGAGGSNQGGNAGGNTTFTGATTATGGGAGSNNGGGAGANGLSASNGGGSGLQAGPAAAGGSGAIFIEYWL